MLNVGLVYDGNCMLFSMSLFSSYTAHVVTPTGPQKSPNFLDMFREDALTPVSSGIKNWLRKNYEPANLVGVQTRTVLSVG